MSSDRAEVVVGVLVVGAVFVAEDKPSSSLVDVEGGCLAATKA